MSEFVGILFFVGIVIIVVYCCLEDDEKPFVNQVDASQNRVRDVTYDTAESDTSNEQLKSTETVSKLLKEDV